MSANCAAQCLKRKPCEVCGTPNALAHHEDYSQPLKVKWLCPQHHADRHKVLRFMYGIKINNYRWKHPIHPINHERRRISTMAKLIEVLQILLRERLGLKKSECGENTISIGPDKIDMTNGECHIVARGPARVATVLVRRCRKTGKIKR